MNGPGRGTGSGGGEPRWPPERDPLEFLSRSWSASAADVSRALASAASPLTAGAIAEDAAGELDDGAATGAAGSSFSFASAATSQLIMDRIMSQSQEASPLTSGRLSHSSGPLIGGGSLSDSPPVSPDLDDSKFYRAVGTPKPLPPARGGSKTVGRWLKDRKERRKEETRAHNAQVHAAVSVAAVAAAVAAMAASATGTGRRRDDMAVASAATLVAAQCVEAAEAMGAERDHLAAAVASAVSARTPGDIATITAAAATALRGAATVRARVAKEAWNVAAVIPVEKGAMGAHNRSHSHIHMHGSQRQQLQQHHNVGSSNSSSFSDDLPPSLDQDVDEETSFLGIGCQELLARGTELLKRTRKGSLHWKVVSVYINRNGMVMLKMKSRHVAGTITKKKKSVVVDVCRDVAAWPGRHLLQGGEHRRYFGLRTAEHRVIEFECASQRDHEMWTKGVARLLAIVNGRKRFA